MADHPNTPSPAHDDDADLRASVEEVLAANRKTRMKWAAAGLSIVAVSVGLFALFATERAFFFRPKPDMKEVERLSFQDTNDPACRELVGNIDALETRWKSERMGLRKLFDATDKAAIEAGLKQVRHYTEVYRTEQRRAQIIITQDPSVTADIARYLRHVLSYLKAMDQLLAERLAELNGVAEAKADDDAKDPTPRKVYDPTAIRTVEIPGLGKVAVTGTPLPSSPIDPSAMASKTPAERYLRAWSAVTEDHDKWRVFRQGPIPCGHRAGDVPPLPDTSSSPFDKAAAAPSNNAPKPDERVARTIVPAPVDSAGEATRAKPEVTPEAPKDR